MAKTKPIGVRFDEELLNKLKNASLATTPQKALNFYEKYYIEGINQKIINNNIPENKERILKEREGAGNWIQKLDATTDAGRQLKISELERELEAIPDKTKGLGKQMSEFIQNKIYKLKYNK